MSCGGQKMKRLLEIQQSLNAPKNLRNSFGNYNYRSCESILEAVKPLLNKLGLVLTLDDELVNRGDKNYVKAIASLFDAETNCIITQASAFARESEDRKGMDDSQITGATSSYARKYALNGLFCIDDNKDPDTDEYQKSEAKTSAPKVAQATALPQAKAPASASKKVVKAF